MVRILPIVLGVAIYIYGILHCALTKPENMPARVPKWGWILLNVLVPVIGAIVWFVALYATQNDKNEDFTPHTLAPDDDPDFLASLDRENRLNEWERQQKKATQDTPKENDILKKLEEELDNPDETDK